MKIPKHVAIILDGNGRWAKKRGMPRNYGHTMGAKNVEVICKAAHDLGIEYVTINNLLYYTVTFVPLNFPLIAFTMLSGSFNPNTYIGILFSIHIIDAVKSTTASFLSITS